MFWWYKPDLSAFLQAELTDYPELLARLDFSQTKRLVASELIASMRRQESKYQAVVIDLLVRLSGFDERFPLLARLEDGDSKVSVAQVALVEVRRVTETYSELAAARVHAREEAERAEQAAERRKGHDLKLAELRQRFLDMQTMSDHWQRGRDLEGLLNGLFQLFDLDPRASYNLEHEQIDGAFTFETDDYILEARWWSEALQPKHLGEFRAKVDSKSKNVLGLLVAIGGFTAGAIALHSMGTPLILVDGADLFAVLDNRISLREVLVRKRRHAAETGSPMLHVSEML